MFLKLGFADLGRKLVFIKVLT